MRINLPDSQRFANILQAITGYELKILPTGVTTDSRECHPGDLFIAITGDQTDGHNYLAQMEQAGSSAALVSEVNPALPNYPQIVVDDPVRSLGMIANRWRVSFQRPVIAITGTNGKTTTKDLLVHILSFSRKIHATSGNYNTSIGLPLTLLTLTTKDEISILEMGANQPGDIALLTNLAHPTHGLITNVAPAHLAGFGSIEEVARTKGELFQALTEGTAFVNRDDTLVARIAIPGDKITFGFQPDCDFSAALQRAEDGAVLLSINNNVLVTGSRNQTFAKNVLAATAIAISLGETWETVQKQLNTFKPPPGRCIVSKFGEITVIDDTYNANLVSVSAALDYLHDFNTSGRHILVFGDMFELGEESQSLHAQVGKKASTTGLDAVFTVGQDSYYTASALSGINYHQHFTTKSDLTISLQKFLKPGDIVLFKGSRGMAMETIIAELQGF